MCQDFQSRWILYSMDKMCIRVPSRCPLFFFFFISENSTNSRTVTDFLLQWEYLKLHLTVIIIRPWNVTHIFSYKQVIHGDIFESHCLYSSHLWLNMGFNRLIWKFDLWYLKKKIVPNFQIDFWTAC